MLDDVSFDFYALWFINGITFHLDSSVVLLVVNISINIMQGQTGILSLFTSVRYKTTQPAYH